MEAAVEASARLIEGDALALSVVGKDHTGMDVLGRKPDGPGMLKSLSRSLPCEAGSSDSSATVMSSGQVFCISSRMELHRESLIVVLGTQYCNSIVPVREMVSR